MIEGKCFWRIKEPGASLYLYELYEPLVETQGPPQFSLHARSNEQISKFHFLGQGKMCIIELL